MTEHTLTDLSDNTNHENMITPPPPSRTDESPPGADHRAHSAPETEQESEESVLPESNIAPQRDDHNERENCQPCAGNDDFSLHDELSSDEGDSNNDNHGNLDLADAHGRGVQIDGEEIIRRHNEDRQQIRANSASLRRKQGQQGARRVLFHVPRSHVQKNVRKNRRNGQGTRNNQRISSQSNGTQGEQRATSSQNSQRHSQRNNRGVVDVASQLSGRRTPPNRQQEREGNANQRNLRQRLPALVTLDERYMNSSMMSTVRSVTLNKLMDEDPSQIPRQTKIDLMLLRVIGNTPNSSNNVRTYGSTRNTRQQANNLNYSRLYLFKVVKGAENHCLVHMMTNRNCNRNLMEENPRWRDDGTATIGSVFRIMHPLPIKSLMANDVPILESRFSALLLKTPEYYETVPVNEQIRDNVSQAFSLNNMHVDLLSMTPEETRCSGLFCDKQRIHEICERNQGCGCFSTCTRRSNIALDHCITVSNTGSAMRHNQSSPMFHECIERFSSNKFSSLYLNGYFPCSVTARDLCSAEGEYGNILEAARNAIHTINANGGFTAIGWYKRGLINDQTIVQGNNVEGVNPRSAAANNNENQVVAAAINYHICYLQPTNQAFLDPATVEGRELERLKYNMSRLRPGYQAATNEFEDIDSDSDSDSDSDIEASNLTQM